MIKIFYGQTAQQEFNKCGGYNHRTSIKHPLSKSIGIKQLEQANKQKFPNSVKILTNSDNIILGFCIAILNGKINPLDVMVYYCDKEVTTLDIDSNGKLSDYPKGFMDASMQAYAKMHRLRREKIQKFHKKVFLYSQLNSILVLLV